MEGNGLGPKLPFSDNDCKADITASLSLLSSANDGILTEGPTEEPVD